MFITQNNRFGATSSNNLKSSAFSPGLELEMEITDETAHKGCFRAAMLALTASSASAAVVCNEDGDCWRVKEQRNYEPSLKLRVMPDDWKWEDREKDRYRWREPGRGNGYWRSGVWVEIN